MNSEICSRRHRINSNKMKKKRSSGLTKNKKIRNDLYGKMESFSKTHKECKYHKMTINRSKIPMREVMR